MRKLFVKLRKRWILPIKWARKEFAQIEDLEAPPAIKLFKIRKEIKDELMAAERLGDKQKTMYSQGQLDFVDWLIKNWDYAQSE